MTPVQVERLKLNEEDGQEIPEALRIPDLFYDAIPFYKAFNELSGTRPTGFSVGMIPFSEISAYLDEEMIFSQEERRRWRHFITLIDRTWVSKQQPKKSSKPRSNTNTMNPGRRPPLRVSRRK